MAAAAARDLDIVVFGATGDTGVASCGCLYFKGKKLGIKSWAPAARNLGKLKKDVLDRLQGVQPGDDGILPGPAIEADGGDYESLKKMCARTRCVVACAGPFALYGEGVVRACAEVGTNYVDVTGETPWVEEMQAKYGEQAAKKGVSLVSCAGYDSIPPDLTAFLAAKALEKEGEQLARFEAFIGGSGGAMPTGTLNTLLSGIASGKRALLRLGTFGVLGKEPASAEPVKVAAAPAPASHEAWIPAEFQPGASSNLLWTMLPGYSPLAGRFCFPHFMAPINNRAVHHTAARSGYGGFEFRERQDMGEHGAASLYGLFPVMFGLGVGSLLVAAAAMPGFCGVAIRLRDKYNTPLQQNVRTAMLSGFVPTGTTTVQGFGISKTGRRVHVEMNSNYDPGLGFTVIAACTTAAQIVKKHGTSSPAKPGYHSAVVTVGGDSLAEGLLSLGVTINTSVDSKP